MTNGSITPRWRRRKDARPEEILDAALACFAENGFGAARLDDVARRAGIVKGTLFRYFESKEALFRAAVGQRLAAAITEFEDANSPRAASAPEAIRGFIDRLVATLASSAGILPRLIVAEAASFPDLARFYVDEVIERGVGVVEGLIRKGIDAGEFRPVPTRTTAFCICAPPILEALFRTGIEPYAGRNLGLSALSSNLSDLILHGLCNDKHREDDR